MGFNEDDRPRVPAGSPQGGQWTRMGTGPVGDWTNVDDLAARQEWERATEFKGAGHLNYDDKPEPSPDTHDYVKNWPGNSRGLWGSSHGASTAIAGESAQQMGIEGYKQIEGYGTLPAKQAKFMLEHIAKDKVGSEEVLYHGFQDLDASKWKAGDTFRIPLTASAGEPGVISYGMRMHAKDQAGPPTLFMFEKGTQMLAYAKWKKKPTTDSPEGEAKEFGYNYTEAIVAGGFKVTEIKTAPYVFNRQWDQGMHPKGGVPEVTIVKLKQVETFNPETNEWEER